MATSALTVSQLAGELGVGVRTVAGWSERYPDFPKPVVEIASGRAWDLEEVRAWHERKAPKAGRPPKSEE
ncbi:MAG TPA: hypothetical protein VI039_12710 [Solirubrobacterales bacterium]